MEDDDSGEPPMRTGSYREAVGPQRATRLPMVPVAHPVSPGAGEGFQVPSMKAGPQPTPPVTFSELLQYNTPRQRFLFFLSVVFSLIKGAAWPIWTFLFGQSISAFAEGESDTVGRIEDLSLYFLYTAVIVGVVDALSFAITEPIGASALFNIQRAFLQSVMRQEMAWLVECV